MFELEDLVYQAVIIIYSDGYIDFEKVDKEKDHVEYYKKLLLNNTRFSEIFKDNKIDFTSRFAVEDILIKNGAIIITNWNLREIVDNTYFVYTQLPSFYIKLSEEKITKQQANIFNKIFNAYPLVNLGCNKYNSITKRYDEYDTNKFLGEVNRIIVEQGHDESPKL